MGKQLDVPGATKTTAEVVAQGADLQVQVVEVARGGGIPPHSHDVSAAFVVISGRGQFTGGRKSRDITAGDYVHIPAGQKHSWAQTGVKPLRFVSVSSGSGIYKPEEKSFGTGLQ
jgi:quercetin dioxygenase-like cupin family protein